MLSSTSLAADGDSLAVGAPLDSHAGRGVDPVPRADYSALNSGAAYVFRERGGDWRQEAYIKADNADPNELFGTSVALEGDMLVVGAPAEAARTLPDATPDATSDRGLEGAGAVYAYRRSGERWALHAYLEAPEPQARAAFGGSLRLDRGRLLVGAVFEGAGPDGDPDTDDRGAAYLYGQVEASAAPRVLRSTSPDPRALFGFAVELDGDWAAIGAPNAADNTGSVEFFDLAQ